MGTYHERVRMGAEKNEEDEEDEEDGKEEDIAAGQALVIAAAAANMKADAVAATTNAAMLEHARRRGRVGILVRKWRGGCFRNRIFEQWNEGLTARNGLHQTDRTL